MDTNHRYQLDSPRVTGRRQEKTTCPRCGRKKCFVRYVDTQRGCQYLSDEVGRCDHELSCAYHYRPSDYFRDRPWLREQTSQPRMPLPPPPRPRPLVPLSALLVDQFHSTQSLFWQWFVRLGFDPERVRELYTRYRLGATHRGEAVFWQIDEQQRVRTGHIMPYGPDGHRLGYAGWVHNRLERRGLLPPGFHLRQCLFGQHLLPVFPDRHVCLVESEKTALVMAAHQPQHLWLATCGSSGLNADRLECLRRRRFTLFPDSGCYGKWQAVMEKTEDMQYNIDQSLEAYPPNTDLADLLLQPP